MLPSKVYTLWMEFGYRT